MTRHILTYVSMETRGQFTVVNEFSLKSENKKRPNVASLPVLTLLNFILLKLNIYLLIVFIYSLNEPLNPQSVTN